MKILPFLTILISFGLRAEDCETVFEMKTQEHHSKEYFHIESCKEKSRFIKSTYNKKMKKIPKQHYQRILRKLTDKDPVVDIKKLEENCSNKKRPFTKATYHFPGKSKTTICLFDNSPPLLHFKNITRELVYSKAYFRRKSR